MLKKALEEARKNMAEIKAAVEKGEKTAEDLQAAIDAVKVAQKNLEAAEAAEKMLKSLGTMDVKEETEEAKTKEMSIGEKAAEAVKNSRKDESGKIDVSASGTKSASVMTTPSSISPALTDVDTRLVEGYRRPLMIADLFPFERISGNAITYFVESTTEEGAPAQTNEGSKKPMISYGDPTPKTVSLVKIAAHWKESSELIEDAPWLADAINGRGIYKFNQKVEDFLVSALTGTSGIGSSTELTADGIFKAMMKVQYEGGYAADAIIINPIDYQNLRLAKDSNNQYYGGGYFYGAYGNTPIAEQPPLWGLRTVVTSAVDQGTCIVGAFMIGGSIIGKDNVTVNMANTNEDDFIKNLITILIEQRLNLVVRRPKAFVVIEAEESN
jgi:HK97 family phage major capsid protein